MRCGRKLLLCLVLFLVLCLPGFSQDVSEMTDMEIIDELLVNLENRESLLVESEALLQERSATLNERESDLETRDESLSERERLLQERENSLTEIETSSKSCAVVTRRLRSLSILLGTTTAGGVLFILFTIFGNPMGG